MHRFLFVALAAGLLSPAASMADLGKAEVGVEKTSIKTWCGKRKNTCVVTFEGERMRIDDGKGISSNQILEYWSGNEGTFGNAELWVKVTYRKTVGGEEATGKFIWGPFGNGRWTSFLRVLRDFAPGLERRDIGPNVELEVK